MGTKNNPGTYDCYANAEPDEPMFVLLARDPLASELVLAWAHQRAEADVDGADEAKIAEAVECAAAMERWRSAHQAHGAADQARRLAAMFPDHNFEPPGPFQVGLLATALSVINSAGYRITYHGDDELLHGTTL